MDANPNASSDVRLAAIARLVADVREARAAGREVLDENLKQAHPDLMPELGHELEKLRRIEAARRAADHPGSPDGAGETAPLLARVPGYSILHELSRGGQGVVYVATQLSTGRKVAIKVLRDGPFADERRLARFNREVQVLAALNHPNIVTIIDTGSTAEGSRYIVMNYIAGVDLGQHMLRRQQKDPDDPSKLLRMFIKICDAVNAAHQKGIVHRDLKPGNIRVDERGEPHVLDFGLARTTLDGLGGGDQQALSVTGEFMGSLPWCSPEQAEGHPDKIDARTDVYSLGVILYQMLTGGRFPYAVVGNMRDVLNNILTAAPTPPSKVIAAAAAAREVQGGPQARRIQPMAVNETIERIVLKALAKEREKRYQSAGEFKREIANYLLGRPATGPGPVTESRVSSGRLRVALVLGCVVLVLVAAPFVVRAIFKTSRIGQGPNASQNVVAASVPPIVEKTFTGHEGRVSAVAVIPERNLLLTGGNSLNRVLRNGSFINDPGTDNTVRFWDLKTGHQTAIIRDGLGQKFTYQVQGIAVSGDGAQVAVATCRPTADFSNPTVSVWRTDTQKRLHYFPLTGRAGLWVPWFSRDGRTLYALRADTALHVFDLKAGKQVSVRSLDAGAVETAMQCACMSPDRTRVFGGMDSGEIRLWTVADGQYVKQFVGHVGAVREVALSDDGQFLASAGSDGTARVWDVSSGRQIALCRVGGVVRSVAFVGSGHGKIVSGGNDSRATLWDVASESEIKHFEGHSETITSLCVSADGRMLVTGSVDTTARTWAIEGPTATTRP